MVLVRLGYFVAFCCRITVAMPACLLDPKVLLVQIARFVLGSLPVVVVLGSAMGLVAWMHLGEQLARFDSSALLPAALMLAVVKEFGPLAVGLMAASRLAAGMAAELAAMTVAEQIDALQLLGVRPEHRLLAPRVLACTLVLPPLTILADYSALLGSFAAEFMSNGLSWLAYHQYALDRLTLWDAILSTSKTAIFGLLVGFISCWYGVSAERNTDGVAHAATNAVLACTLAVVIADVYLVRLLQALGG